VPALAAAVIAALDDPAAAQARAVAARARLTADFDWQTVAARTVAVCAGAKRTDRQPQTRREIPENPLPGR
jgi:glycogen(starch) synthase